MPFVKLEYIYKIMEEKELPFFKVTDGKTLIGKNNEESEPAKAIELLQDIIEMVEDPIISISLSAKNDKSRGGGGSNWDNYAFKVRLRQSEGVAGTGGVNGTILQMMKENADLMMKLQLQSKEHEMEELRKQIKEIKEAKNKPDVWEKYLPLLAAHFSPGSTQPVAVAGAADGPVNESFVEKQKILKLALIRLSKVDTELPATLTTLADFAEKHPEKYKAFIPVMKSQI